MGLVTGTLDIRKRTGAMSRVKWCNNNDYDILIKANGATIPKVMYIDDDEDLANFIKAVRKAYDLAKQGAF